MNPVPVEAVVVDMGFREWIRTRDCVVVMCQNPALCAHLPRVRRHGDKENCLPVCDAHHKEQHDMGRWSWALKHGLDLTGLAQTYWRRYQQTRVAVAFR